MIVAQAATTAAERAELVAFVVLAPVAVIAALGMVFNRNAVYSALLLVVNFFCLAAFYVLLDAQFLAAVQVIVYAGAIMVLFLFVLMLLGVDREETLRETIRGQRAAAAALCVLLFAGVTVAVVTGTVDVAQGGLAAANRGGNVQAVGRLLFTRYTLAFEATGVLLLVAGVGSLLLARRQPRATAAPAPTAAEVPPPPAEAPAQPEPAAEREEAKA